MTRSASASCSELAYDRDIPTRSWGNFVASWRPSKGWASTALPAAQTIERDPASAEATTAWCNIAMMLGDTRASELALIVCLHAEATAPADGDVSRLAAHRELCLLDLGLAQATRPGPLPLAEIGAPELTQTDATALDAWRAEQLAPFDGDLARAAQAILALVVARVQP
jgi:hypothetical protein